MLLPSALQCDAHLVSSKPTRPRLVTFAPYQPPKSTESALQASCRALQSILGGSLNTSCQSPLLQSAPLCSHQQQKMQNRRVLRSSPLKPEPPRGANKRCRDDFEGEDEEMIMGCQKENIQHEYATPKRQRRAPLSMPLGLSAEDFAALDRPSDKEIELDMPDTCGSEDSEQEWTTDDDRMLVETVLEKLNLSKREWNDCARILGKRKGSLGIRWKALVGEGNVGLRRGTRMARTTLDIRSW